MIPIQLKPEEVNLLMGALFNRPYGEVAGLVRSLEEQINRYVAAQQSAGIPPGAHVTRVDPA